MRRTIASIGRTLVTLGLLILMFVAYQLWGTGIFTARAQDDLKKEFAAQLRAHPRPADDPVVRSSTTATTDPGVSPTTSATVPVDPSVLSDIQEGDPAGRIQIDKIGVDWVFVQGTERDDLKKGPGHYPATPFPGQIGNAAIAGHRTTYKAPFGRLDELAVDDPIVVTTLIGTYTYTVTDKLVVRPDEFGVVANTPDPQLTLTTCNPKFSASQRLVIKAKLVVAQSDTPAPTTPPVDTPAKPRGQAVQTHRASLEQGLDGEHKSRSPAVAWGIITAVLGLVWWWCFRRWRHPATWALGVAPFLALLFVFYVYLERALPAGY